MATVRLEKSSPFAEEEQLVFCGRLGGHEDKVDHGTEVSGPFEAIGILAEVPVKALKDGAEPGGAVANPAQFRVKLS